MVKINAAPGSPKVAVCRTPSARSVAAEAAVALARHEKVESTSAINNGKVDVPSVLLEPLVVDKNNIVDTVIKDGYQKLEDVYRNVLPDQRPKAKLGS